MNNNDKIHCFKLRKDYLVVDQKNRIRLDRCIIFARVRGLNDYN